MRCLKLRLPWNICHMSLKRNSCEMKTSINYNEKEREVVLTAKQTRRTKAQMHRGGPWGKNLHPPKTNMTVH